MDRLGQQIRKNIRMHGWHVQHVLAAQTAPPFSYTIGLYRTHKHPELVILGLRHEIMDTMIRSVEERIAAGERFEDGARHDDILQGFDCLFRTVELRWYPDYFGRAIDFYRDKPFPVLQCLWPDREGRFPGDPKFDRQFLSVQPALFGSVN
jgi:hypothetical protein